MTVYYAITNRFGPIPNRKRETAMGGEKQAEWEQISEPDQGEVAADEAKDLDVDDVEVGAINPEDDEDSEDDDEEDDDEEGDA